MQSARWAPDGGELDALRAIAGTLRHGRTGRWVSTSDSDEWAPPSGAEGEGHLSDAPHRNDSAGIEAHLRTLTTGELLREYSGILTVLLERGVVRSRNAPAGDLSEALVARAYGGTLAPPSQKDVDVELSDGTRLQVKGRVVGHRGGGGNYGVLRGWEFDRCVFVTFDWRDYAVLRAVDVPAASFRDLANHSAHVNAWIVPTSVDLLALPGAVDVTEKISTALESL